MVPFVQKGLGIVLFVWQKKGTYTMIPDTKCASSIINVYVPVKKIYHKYKKIAN